MPRALKTIAIVLAVQGALGLAVAAVVVFGGAFNVAATAQHWRATAWLVHLTMRHSVARRAPDGPPPPFDTAMVARGAGHFRLGCAPCHGAPGERPSAVERNAEPPPPPYAAFAEWSPQELFWLVKHGVKLTAMPAWPTQERDDEVWDMAAFLAALPTMTPDRFSQLATGQPGPKARFPASTGDQHPALSNIAAAQPITLERCLPCHGRDGTGGNADSRDGAFPNIAGLSAEYIAGELRAFRNGGRPSGYMQRAASNLTDGDIDELASYFAAQPRVAPAATSGGLAVESRAPDRGAPDAEAIALGRRIAHNGTTSGHAPACVSCHALDDRDRTPQIPDLAGQPRDYLAKQLALFATGVRGGTPEAPIMSRIAADLSPEYRAAVAAYFASEAGDGTTARLDPRQNTPANAP